MPLAPARSLGYLHSGSLRRGRMARLVAIAALLIANSSIAASALAAADATKAGAAPRVAPRPGGRPPSEGNAPANAQHLVQVKRPASPPDVTTGPDSLQLLSQTQWVDPGSTQFQLHLKITAQSPGNELLAVDVYPGLTTRSQFQGALGGEFYGSYYQPGGGPVSLTDLARDPNGGVDVDIPVNQSSGELSGTGVYPVQAFLEQDGVPKGKPLTTFIVYAGKDLSSLRLDASFVLPMVGNVQIGPLGSPGPLSSGSAATLQGDAADLARWHVPVTVRAADPTLQSMARGTPAGRAALADLREAVAAGDELLPATALPLNIPELIGSGLTQDSEPATFSGQHRPRPAGRSRAGPHHMGLGQ